MNSDRCLTNKYICVVFAVFIVPASVSRADEPSPLSNASRTEFRSDAVAGPMVCWNPQDDHLYLWFLSRGDGPTKLHYRINNTFYNVEVAAPSTPISIEAGKAHDLPREGLRVELLDDIRTDDPRSNPIKITSTATFRRIPPKGESGRFSFAFGSCAHQERFGEHQPIWSAIAKDAPDCFFFIGDNIYLPSDPATFPAEREAVLKMYRELYAHNRRMPELQPLLRSTYCFGIWDDHDYGPNNADKSWRWKDVAMEAFAAHFPGDYGLPGASGCFHRFSWGDVDVFMLDDRSFRDANDSPDPAKSMFGAAQLAWLKDGLKASTAKVKLVVNGNQMLSDKHVHESWGTFFRPERDAFLRWLWDEKIAGVFFLAGDRHFAELIHKRDPQGVGADIWELTSSPLANAHFTRGGMFKNPERIAKYTDGVNYGLVRVDTTQSPAVVELIAKDVNGKVVIEQRVKIATAK